MSDPTPRSEPAPPPPSRGRREPAAAEGTRRLWWRSSSWWYLSYLVLLIFPLAFNPDAEAFHWVGTGVVVALFLPLYVVGERAAGPLRRRCTVAVVVLGVAAVWVNSAASVLFIYAAAWAGTFQPRRHAQRALLGLTGLLALLGVLSPVPLPYRLWAFFPATVFVWVVGVAVMEEVDRQQESRRLRIDNARVGHLATASERERIARDLHDLIGHALTSVVVRAQLVQRLAAEDPDRAAAEGVEIERTAREALANVRATVQGWRRASLDDELEAARTALAAAEITLHVERDPAVQPAPTVEAALALSLREAITNVVRHAGASRVTVTIGVLGGEVALRVADDGRGGNAPEGGGLTGMRDRIAALGGHVERAVQAGTTLTVSVPLELAG